MDTSIVKLGNGKVLVSTTDPLSLIRSLGARDSAWLSAHLIASDIATSGLGPKYGIFDFNLPPSMTDFIFASYWGSFHKACRELGLAIIGGHTGRFAGCEYPIIGAGVMMTVGPEDRFLTSAMASVGDDLILTKGAAVETTAVLARAFPRRVKRALGVRLFENARRYLGLVTVVEDALTAASVGIRGDGVTAMHDATEGGVIAAAFELASASNLGLILDLDEIEVSEETQQVCKLFGINPLTSLSEGSLLISTRPFATSRVLHRLSSKGLAARVVGRLVPKSMGVQGASKHSTSSLSYPRTDPYWKAFQAAVSRGWS